MTAPTELDDIAVIKAVGALIDLNPDASATTKAETVIRAYLGALPAEQDYSNLLSIITDIRMKSGVGGKPMLSELADAIAEKIAASGAGWRESQASIDVTEALLDAEKALKQIVDAMMPGQARRLARDALIVIGPAVASVLPAAPDRRAGE